MSAINLLNNESPHVVAKINEVFGSCDNLYLQVFSLYEKLLESSILKTNAIDNAVKIKLIEIEEQFDSFKASFSGDYIISKISEEHAEIVLKRSNK